jgi:hypothetical protein
MCGKFCSYDNFSVSKDVDVVAVEVRGLGRGKGVKVEETYSILEHDNVNVRIIGVRLLELLEVFLENNCLNPYDVYKVLPEDYRDEVINEYIGEVDELQTRLAQCQELVEELSEEVFE